MTAAARAVAVVSEVALSLAPVMSALLPRINGLSSTM